MTLTTEMKATFMHELARYAREKSGTSSVSTVVEGLIGPDAGARAAAQRLVRRYERMPILQRAVLGLGGYENATAADPQPTLWANVMEMLRARADADAKGGSVTAPSASGTYRIDYTGMTCVKEMSRDRWSNSDEIYIVTSVAQQGTAAAAAAVVPGAVNSRKQPRGKKVYGDVDTGDWEKGPVDTCWTGVASDLLVVAAVFEHDNGDPDAFKEEIHIAVTIGLAIAQAAGAPSAISYLQPLIEWGAKQLIGAGDDLIEIDSRPISARSLASMAAAEPTKDLWTGFIPHHFYTRHRGGGADYKTLFRVSSA